MDLFSIKDKVIVITGGAGVIGGALADGMAQLGAKIVILNRKEADAKAKAEQIIANGGTALGLEGNVLDETIIKTALQKTLSHYGNVDVLINVAGGNMPGATIGPDKTFFDLSLEDFSKVVDLNLKGTVLPTMIFSEPMSKKGSGTIINISSMTAQQPFTRVVGYGASKAGIDNFTKWLAVEMNQKFGEGIRVNAIAPGVFVGKQNKSLLIEESGNYTPRGKTIIDHTPMKRFGVPDELVGTAVWLASDASNFVTGVVVPVDGGFSAFSGV
ncbi:MAG: SDR family oxidoreductase [Flavobacteriales bacterium]|nr:SDR family oxidoreductase [Flavobacteriales bacterium]